MVLATEGCKIGLSELVLDIFLSLPKTELLEHTNILAISLSFDFGFKPLKNIQFFVVQASCLLNNKEKRTGRMPHKIG